MILPKMNGLVALSAASLSFSAPAFAATTHLQCIYTNSDAEKVLADVALSEERRTADIWFHNTNAGSQWSARFTEKTVMVTINDQDFITIDRTSLRFTRVFLQAGADRIYEHGTCKKSVPPKRAF